METKTAPDITKPEHFRRPIRREAFSDFVTRQAKRLAAEKTAQSGREWIDTFPVVEIDGDKIVV